MFSSWLAGARSSPSLHRTLQRACQFPCLSSWDQRHFPYASTDEICHGCLGEAGARASDQAVVTGRSAHLDSGWQERPRRKVLWEWPGRSGGQGRGCLKERTGESAVAGKEPRNASRSPLSPFFLPRGGAEQGRAPRRRGANSRAGG